jgi:hypothetical protein
MMRIRGEGGRLFNHLQARGLEMVLALQQAAELEVISPSYKMIHLHHGYYME